MSLTKGANNMARSVPKNTPSKTGKPSDSNRGNNDPRPGKIPSLGHKK